NAIKELYPGINNTVTFQELDEYIAKILISIDNFDNDVLFVDFWEIMQQSMAKIHDCHITLFEPLWKWHMGTNYSPQIRFGWICDKLICTMAIDIYEQYIGKEIVRINGLSTDSIKEIITSKITSYDSKVKGFVEFVCATTGMLIFFEKYGNYNMEVEFADGEIVNFISETSKNRHRYVGSWFNFHKINAHQEGYSTKVLNDSTAYLGISTFNNFSQVAIDDIATFIKSLPQTHNLIIDLRNNYGGSDEVVSKIFSFVVLDTLRLEGYSKVNKKGGFNTVLMNYYGVDEDIFPEFSKKEGKDGFYKLNNSFYAPDSSVNFKGKLYVLINENSVSAASLFASLVVRSHRGAIVGRESRNAYHFMNAAKFGDFKLPNSTLIVRIPLVEIVFDTVVNQRVPWGRGVLPDYFVPLTLDELTSKNGDSIINYTLKLIANGEYISKENPFTMQVQKQYNIQHYWAFIVICSALIGLIFLYLRHK
ncbi:MAG: S41 family peptidase, partial [Mucinivorans sp.]